MENSMTDRSTKEDKQKLQLPKNIRQIGNIQGAVRIYVEDYVYTYLHGSGRSGWAHRGCVFLGNRFQENGQKYIFISGLVNIPDENFHDGIPEFTDLMWGGIYQEMKQFYEDVEILGWGMDLAGTSAKLTGDLERLHRNAFQGQDKLLFLMDSLENEEAFYVYEKNMLRRRDGYYVYYEKNPQMQEYMMKGKDEKENGSEIDPQRAVVTSYRAMTAEKNRKGGKGFRAFVYVASLALLVSVSAMGVNMMSSAGKIHRLEEAVSYLQTDGTSEESKTVSSDAVKDSKKGDGNLSLKNTQSDESITESKLPSESNLFAGASKLVEESKNSAQVAQTEAGTDLGTDSEGLQTEQTAEEALTEEEQQPLIESQSSKSEKDEEKKTDKGKEEGKEEASEKEDSKQRDGVEKKENTAQKQEESKTQATLADQDYYVVQKGESLLGISQKLYGKDRTEELCTRNHLEDENKIYAGQKLLLLDK